MPCYSISPFPAQRRVPTYYNPYQAFFGAPQVTLAPRYSGGYSYSAPSPLRALEADLASFDNFFQELNHQIAAATKASEAKAAQAAKAPKPFQPRFDVHEESDKFILRGELPDVQSEHLSIDFVDKNTLVVKGKVVKQESHGTPPAQAVEQQQQQSEQTTSPDSQDTTKEGATVDSEETDDFVEVENPSSPSTNYHKASVTEDDSEERSSETSTPAEQQPLLQDASEQEVSQSNPQNHQAEQETSSEQYHVEERVVAEFSRAFRFPGKVDQDSVRASLRDGILTVDVPKFVEKVQGRRSIQINSE